MVVDMVTVTMVDMMMVIMVVVIMAVVIMMVVDIMVVTMVAMVMTIFITTAHRIDREPARMATSMEEKSSRVLNETWSLKRVKHPQPTVATRSTLGTMIW